MSSRRKSPRRRDSKPVPLFIVEGYTEENYIRLLKKRFKFGADIENCKGGSSKRVLEIAKRKRRQHSDNYAHYVIWFDADTHDSQQTKNLIDYFGRTKDSSIYISKPCVENWLLAHFQPPLDSSASCQNCTKVLQNYILNYDKNDSVLLERYIKDAQVIVAIENCSELGKFVTEFFL